MEPPSQNNKKYWLWCGPETPTLGKWMFFYQKDEIDSKWAQLCLLFQKKELPGVVSMKVSTKKNCHANKRDTHVVFVFCVYTDEASVKSVAQNILDKTNYFCYEYGSNIYYKPYQAQKWKYYLKTNVPLRLYPNEAKPHEIECEKAKYIILDIETNGIGSFRPGNQRPIEIAYRALNSDKKLMFKFEGFVKGVTKIDWGKEKECPYSVAEVNSKGVELETIMTDLNKLISNETIIVGHNIAFDLECLNHWSRVWLKDVKTFDTMTQSRELCKLPSKSGEGFKAPKLSELASFLKIEVEGEKLHTAYYDVLITGKCFLALLEREL